MSTLNHKAYAVRQKEIDYKTTDLVMMQAQLINRNSEGSVMVEKSPKMQVPIPLENTTFQE